MRHHRFVTNYVALIWVVDEEWDDAGEAAGAGTDDSGLYQRRSRRRLRNMPRRWRKKRERKRRKKWWPRLRSRWKRPKGVRQYARDGRFDAALALTEGPPGSAMMENESSPSDRACRCRPASQRAPCGCCPWRNGPCANRGRAPDGSALPLRPGRAPCRHHYSRPALVRTCRPAPDRRPAGFGVQPALVEEKENEK